MDMLISDKLNISSVPESYILPPEKRPGKCILPRSDTIPVIDLSGENRTKIVHQIIQASQEFGFFQVINHGIAETLINEMMGVGEEFFQMPAEDRVILYSEDPKQMVRVSTGSVAGNKETRYWRDALRHPCFPLEKVIDLWPSKPTRYRFLQVSWASHLIITYTPSTILPDRQITGSYATEVRKLGLRLMELIGEGLGTKSYYFHDLHYIQQGLVINHYPRCPDPSLTLGLPKHSDPNLLTILLQGDVAGLQVLNNGEWMVVDPLPNAFVVNLGHQLPIISNGKLKSAEHRAVTNANTARTTVASFLYPSDDSIVQPAPEFVDELNPPIFKAFKYHEFVQKYTDSNTDSEKVLEHFKLLPE